MALRQPPNGRLSLALERELQDPEFRHEFMAEHIRSGIAYQIRAMRDARGWNQKKLAAKAGKPQSVVSRLEDPDYGKVTIFTLIELAKAFDVALLVRFVGFGELLIRTTDLSPDALNAPNFDDDPLIDGAMEHSDLTAIQKPGLARHRLGSYLNPQPQFDRIAPTSARQTASLPVLEASNISRTPFGPDRTGVNLS